MSGLTTTAKAQVTLRRDVMQHLGIRPGEIISVSKLPNGLVEIKAAEYPGQIADVFDLFKRADGPSLSIDEMNRIAAEGWAGKR